MEMIMDYIGQYAFPIVMCIIMAWYVKYQTDNNRADINAINQMHKEETERMTTALANNTLAIQHLTDMLAMDRQQEDNHEIRH